MCPERLPPPASSPEGESRRLPAAEFLRQLPAVEAPLHPVQEYATALERFPGRVRRLLGAGAGAVALELEDGNVLKISQGELKPEHGRRPFDLPMLAHDTFRVDRGEDFPTEGYYLVQPMADTDVSFEDTRRFIDELRAQGFRDIDIGYHGQKQLGWYEGKLYLLDYKAVGRLPP